VHEKILRKTGDTFCPTRPAPLHPAVEEADDIGFDNHPQPVHRHAMPQLLEHIDAIARKLNRDVLYLEFLKAQRPHLANYRSLESRMRITQRLDSEGIGWRECGQLASETVMRSYAGEIFVDVPYDENDDRYRKVQTFLEHPDGSMRFDDVRFYVVSLQLALKNVHHDEPGFWDRWADNF
jgi:hypothetical protein